MKTRWRLLIDSPATAARNMAIDEAILRVADKHPQESRPTLRFYQWEPSAVSIGYGQRIAEFDLTQIRSNGYGFVRRVTGGGAIFHHREMTFSFVASVSEGDAPADTGKVYSMLNEGLVAGLKLAGADVRQRGCEDACTNNTAAFCTVRTSPYDIVYQDKKLVGTSQRWTKRVVLEHGFIPLEPNPMTPEVLPLCEVIGHTISFSDLVDAMCSGFEDALDLDLVSGTMADEERKVAREFTEKYSSREWNERI
ncbi:MAG: biotin/lipoate A/B protein ligase family protein [Planctomycetota bacterium]|nr:biotin/lipoate A/B protein ligase family protein [Planctomycetota bacterium]